jgi:hypothetical protein
MKEIFLLSILSVLSNSTVNASTKASSDHALINIQMPDAEGLRKLLIDNLFIIVAQKTDLIAKIAGKKLTVAQVEAAAKKAIEDCPDADGEEDIIKRTHMIFKETEIRHLTQTLLQKNCFDSDDDCADFFIKSKTPKFQTKL